MNALAVLFYMPVFVLAYNVDVNYPIIYSDPMAKAKNESSDIVEGSYFGYTVILHIHEGTNTSWVFVGAPRSDAIRSSNSGQKYPKRPGIVYRCSEKDSCRQISPDKLENEKGYIADLSMSTVIKKDDGWFGAAMSIERKRNLLTICAPRTILSILNPPQQEYLDTMHGMCYNGVVTSDKVSIEDKDATTHNFRSSSWYNPLHGFSIHYPSPQNSKYVKNRIIGEPKHELYGTVDIRYLNRRKTISLPVDDELSQFGYCVTSGHYFGKDQLYFAGGAPGWQYVGQVGIIAPLANNPIIAILQGNDMGEFFGASLSTGDLNGDGFHDLLVGAPHWGQDNGKVYIYLGSATGKFETTVTIEGPAEGIQFGYALTCGDLDADGYDDIVVGAPWEEAGVIYVYTGDADFREKDRLTPTQRIAATVLHQYVLTPGPKIERFGFSLSDPIDIDNNGFPDIAVGAYKSGHAIILRCKPVIETQLNVYAIPNILQRNTSSFLLSVCVTYYANTQLVKIKIDQKYKRTLVSTDDLIFSGAQKVSCNNINITIKENVQNFIDPIGISAEHEFVNTSSTFCKTCAVEYKGVKTKSIQLSIPFDIGCGDDNVCSSNISVVTAFHGVQDNDTWLIGSSDISLETTLKNHGEPAHVLSITFTLPQGIILRSVLPSCQEGMTENKVTVTCDMGNPLEKGSQKSVKLDFDMRHMFNGMLHGRTLDFYMTINTRSGNSGVKRIQKTLTLKSQASLSLNGKAHEESYYMPALEDATLNISFQQTYQIVKLGATPIINAQLRIKLPVAKKKFPPYLHMYRPQLYITGKLYDCISEDINWLKTSEKDIHDYVYLNQYDLFSKGTNKEKLNERLISYAQISQIVRGIQLNVTTNNKISYLNCTRSDLQCATIICDISELKTPHDIGKLLIKMIFDTARYKESFPKKDRIAMKFSTEASVNILQPASRLPVPGTRSLMELTTSFYLSPKVQKLQIWVLIVSVSLGLILLCIVIVVLRTLGFFKRKKTQDLSSVSSNDAISPRDSQTGEDGDD